MRGKLIFGLVVVLGAIVAFRGSPATRGEEKDDGPMIVHNVFFSLKESNEESRKKLVALCKKHLTKHEGEVYFAAGPIVESLKREVNDRDFDVCLTIVFKNMAAHDKYQDHPRHLEFIKQGKAGWKKVRVFDSYTRK